jgi:non-specific serine/threonine protein kinase
MAKRSREPTSADADAPASALTANTNLPEPLTSFVGREPEIAAVTRLIADSRLITLTGAGGCGKTRLAIQIGRMALAGGDYPGGVWLVNLALLRDELLLPQFVAQALDLRLSSDQPLSDALSGWLQPRRVLLLLDNCEHLRAACARLARSLLATAARLKILATSREPLRIPGELVYPLPPLPVPTLPAPKSGRMADPMDYASVQLFVDRARASVPAFALSPENLDAVVSICRRLDGLPLAIELASRRVNVLTVQEIAAHLDDRFTLLAGAGEASDIPHHGTLRQAIDWSYESLGPVERTVLQRLAVFIGGCSLDTASQLCTGIDGLPTRAEGADRSRMLELVSSLVAKSLLLAETLGRSEARYSLLETIREYALEKLSEAGEADQVRNMHLDLFTARAEADVRGQDSPMLRVRNNNDLVEEHDNFRAALAWALESGRIETGLRLAVALHRFWLMGGYLAEGRTWLERLLSGVNGSTPSHTTAQALVSASRFAGLQGDRAIAAARLQEAMDIATRLGETGHADGVEMRQVGVVLAQTLTGRAGIARAAGDYSGAFKYLARSIHLYSKLGDRNSLAFTMQLQAITAIALDRYEVAGALLDRSLALVTAMGDAYGLALTLNYRGDLARCSGDYIRAQTAYEQSLSYLRKLRARRDIAGVLHNLAHTHLHKGGIEEAQALLRESLELHLEQANTQGIAECVVGFAAVAVALGLYAEAARLLGAAQALDSSRSMAMWPAARMEYDRTLLAVRTSLTEPQVAEMLSEGQWLSAEQAVALALSLGTGTSTEALGSGASEAPPRHLMQGGLSRREREVLTLIARGKSNAEIAAELVLSKRTVEKHIGNILGRQGLANRAQMVRWAIENGLA